MDTACGGTAGPRVLLVSSQDLRPELEQTVLWRSGVERRHADDFAAAFEDAKRFHPKLVVVEGPPNSPCVVS